MAHPVICITGPTASGKSAAALALAEREHGVIINTDSQQVYQELRILTARPSPEEEARVPHYLYGHVSASVNYSAGAWLREVVPLIQKLWEQGQMPILVGGTGLYFQALMDGLAEIPEIPAEVRQEAREQWQKAGTAAFADELLMRDPQLAGHIDRDNPQRLLRAWEVLEATGQSIREWQQVTEPPLPEAEFTAFAFWPEREEVYQRINQRVLKMLELGAIQEAKYLLKLRLDPTLPAMRSIGVQEFGTYLEGEVSLEDAIARTQQLSRRYAKRQFTWLKRYGGRFQTVKELPNQL